MESSADLYIIHRPATFYDDPERGGPATPNAPPPALYIAQQDILIPRPDLGPNSYTQVRAGDRIPPQAVPFL